MKEKMRKFMDEPLTMRRCLKMTVVSYAGAAALLAIYYGINKLKEVREKRKLEQNWNDMSGIDLE